MIFVKSILFVLQMLSAILVVVLVLFQNGKGAESGFASIGSDSLFGAKGSANFLSRATAIAVTVFFIATIAIVAIDTRLNSSTTGLGVMANATAANNNVQTVTPAKHQNSINKNIPN